VEDGLRAAATLLDELGLPLARSDGAAVRRIVWERTRLRWRGTALGSLATPRERLALEALNELAQPITSVEFLRGAALSVEHVRRALEAGDPAHAARALAYEGVLRTTRKPSVEHATLFERARELAESTGDSAVIAHVLVQRAMASIAQSDFGAARDVLVSAHELLSTQCPDQRWWLTSARMHLGAAWHYLGEHDVLASHAETWVVDAKRRGDCHAYAALSGYGFGSHRHLLRGNPDAALEELTEAMAPWPREPISLHHIGALWGTLDALHLKGGDGGLVYLEKLRPCLQKSPLVKSRSLKMPMAWWEASAAFAAMERAPDERSQLAQRVLDQVRTLRALATPLSIAFGNFISAALSTLRGQRERALVEVRAAHPVLVAHHHNTRNAAQYLEGWLEGGVAGRAKVDEALAAERARGWRDPLSGLEVILPVFHLLGS
jgi:hypothetical protein